jgi:DNA-binding NtrC family response regulator
MSWKSARFFKLVQEVGRLLDLVTTIGPTRVAVLVLGPRWSAVDLVTEAVHACSPREARPFVSVRCGLYPSATPERELFGAQLSSNSYIRRRSPDTRGAIHPRRCRSLARR